MIRNAIQRFMYGRYGNDQLNLFLMGLYLLLYLVYLFLRVDLLYLVSFVLLFVTLFRMLSRNMERRRMENLRFMRAANPVISWFRLRRQGGIRKQYVNFRALSPLFPKILAARPDMRYTVGIHRIREGAL